MSEIKKNILHKAVVQKGIDKGRIRNPQTAQEEANTILELVGRASPEGYHIDQKAKDELNNRSLDYVLTAQAEKTVNAEAESMTDSLTGLLSRRAIMREVQEAMNKVERLGGQIQVIVTDVRDFKWINDHAGHRAGDYALLLIATALRGNVRGYDVIGRIGGDENLLLLSDGDSAVPDFIRERLHNSLSKENFPYNAIKVDFGVADYNPKRDGKLTVDELVHRADQAMYDAKKNKLDHVARWDPSMADIIIPEEKQ